MCWVVGQQLLRYFSYLQGGGGEAQKTELLDKSRGLRDSTGGKSKAPLKT